MAWSDDGITMKTVFGDKRIVFGSYTQANGDTGGTLNTGLRIIESIIVTGEVLTISNSGGVCTVVTVDPAAANTGNYMAIGY